MTGARPIHVWTPKSAYGLEFPNWAIGRFSAVGGTGADPHINEASDGTGAARMPTTRPGIPNGPRARPPGAILLKFRKTVQYAGSCPCSHAPIKAQYKLPIAITKL